MSSWKCLLLWTLLAFWLTFVYSQALFFREVSVAEIIRPSSALGVAERAVETQMTINENNVR